MKKEELLQETVAPPSLEQLMEWEMEGGCEAACPENCWVAPDGVCPHGFNGWLIELGYI